MQKLPEIDNFESIRDIWWVTFLWAFFTLFIVHVLATLIAFATLRKHNYGRFAGVLVLVHGTVSSLLVTSFTSVLVALILKYSDLSLQHVHVMLCGLAQAALYLFFSFSTVMTTL